MALPGVHYVLTGEELAAATEQLMNGLDTPEVRRYPLALKQARYVGEWVAAVVAETRALAEDGAELVEVNYEPLPFVIDPEAALRPDAPLVHPPHGSNVLLDRTFVWGEVEARFRRGAKAPVVPRRLGPQLDGADRDLRRYGRLGSVARTARRLGLDPDAEICRSDRARAAAARQRGARALRYRCRRQLRRQARHQAHHALRAISRAASAGRCG